MALYAIGDVQGCDRELGALLDAIEFSRDRDRLWFVGDLVNRGPDSLGVLRRIRALGDAAVTVLGNHDLHFLAVALGCARTRGGDTLHELLNARDRGALTDWLISRPLVHEDADRRLLLLHAGLPPQWDLPTAIACAREFEQALQRAPERLFDRMYGDSPDLWSADLDGAATSALHRELPDALALRGRRGAARARRQERAGQVARSASLIPWFDAADASWRGTRIVFGHWSTLGFFRNADVIGLDTGCVWGGRLTALRLDVADAAPVSVGCTGPGAA